MAATTEGKHGESVGVGGVAGVTSGSLSLGGRLLSWTGFGGSGADELNEEPASEHGSSCRLLQQTCREVPQFTERHVKFGDRGRSNRFIILNGGR